MKLFDGKKTAAKIKREIKARIKEKKIRPVLAIILVGEEESSKLYVRLKKEAGKEVGIEVQDFYFETGIGEEKIIEKIEELNQNEAVHGIIVQLPLPGIYQPEKIIEVIAAEKDVDGFQKDNLKFLKKGEPCFLPVLPLAILTALVEALKNKYIEKSILAMVNSEIFGRTFKMVLEREGVKDVNYLVRNTCMVLGAERNLKSADVLITVCGCPNMIKGEMIKEGAVLIDAGITRYHDGKVVGDVDRESVKDRAAFLTPVPGGIGPLTVALLLRNVYLAAMRKKD